MRRWPAVPRRSSGIWFAVCALAFWGAAVPAVTSAAETWVRSESPKVRAAIAFAKERSATFRRLPESLDSTDGLVFIIEGACPRGVGACLHLSVEIAGPRRLLWVFVNPRWFQGCEMVGAIAHELQHAMEALAEPNVRTSTDLFRLFERIGPTASGTFETDDALEMGGVVTREACRKAR